MRNWMLLLGAASTALTAPASADTLVDNVDGVTLDANNALDHFNGFVIDNDGKVKQVLHRGDKRPKTDFLLNGKGQFVMPGLIDSHAHVMSVGLAAMSLDLSETHSLAEALADRKSTRLNSSHG